MSDRFVAVAKNVLIQEKMSFLGTSGQVYRICAEARGATKWFVAESKEEFDSWPAQHVICDVECDLEPNKDGSFRLVRPRFTPPASTRPPKSA